VRPVVAEVVVPVDAVQRLPPVEIHVVWHLIERVEVIAAGGALHRPHLPEQLDLPQAGIGAPLFLVHIAGGDQRGHHRALAFVGDQVLLVGAHAHPATAVEGGGRGMHDAELGLHRPLVRPDEMPVPFADGHRGVDVHQVVAVEIA